MNRPRFAIVPLIIVTLIEAVSLVLLSCMGIYARIETVINDNPDIFHYTVEIDNGTDRIEPLVFLHSSREQISETNIVMKDYVGMAYFDMVEHQDEIPAIEESDLMTLIISDTITYHSVWVYDSSGERLCQWESWREYQELDKGIYFLVLHIHNEANGEYVNAGCLFVLNVN